MSEFNLQPVIAVIATLLLTVLGLLWRRGRRPVGDGAQEPDPPPPKHTAAEHETAIVLEEADIIDDVAADFAVDPNTVAELIELADKTRK